MRWRWSERGVENVTFVTKCYVWRTDISYFCLDDERASGPAAYLWPGVVRKVDGAGISMDPNARKRPLDYATPMKGKSKRLRVFVIIVSVLAVLVVLWMIIAGG